MPTKEYLQNKVELARRELDRAKEAYDRITDATDDPLQRKNAAMVLDAAKRKLQRCTDQVLKQRAGRL
jgi:hypothetical protein